MQAQKLGGSKTLPQPHEKADKYKKRIEEINFYMIIVLNLYSYLLTCTSSSEINLAAIYDIKVELWQVHN